MNSLKITKEKLPTRCEICHKKDLFDAYENICERCNKQSGVSKLAHNKTIGALNRNVSILQWYFNNSINKHYYFIGWFCSSTLVLSVCYFCYVLGDPLQVTKMMELVLGFALVLLFYTSPVWLFLLSKHEESSKNSEITTIFSVNRKQI